MNCNVIKDLLPLYAEDMCSPESKELVEEHLRGCEGCTKELEGIRNMPRLPLMTDTAGLARVSAIIQKKRTLTALTAVMTMIALLVTGVVFMMTPIYLPVDQAIEGVELREDGGLAIDYASGIMGHGGTSFGSENEEFHWTHTTRYDWLKSKLTAPNFSKMPPEELEAYIQKHSYPDETYQDAYDRILNIHVEYGVFESQRGSFWIDNSQSRIDGLDRSDWELVSPTSEQNVWYVNSRNPKNSTEIWHGAQRETAGIPYGITGVYVGIFGGSLLIAVILIVIAGKKKDRIWELCRWVALLGFSVSITTLLVTGGNLITLSSMAEYKWPGMIVCEAAALWLTLLAWRSLQRVNKK